MNLTSIILFINFSILPHVPIATCSLKLCLASFLSPKQFWVTGHSMKFEDYLFNRQYPCFGESLKP